MGRYVAWNNRKNSPGWIEEESGCHIWVGVRNPKGYGRAVVRGRHLMVHRMRYENEVGPIPEGMILDHFVCDNPSCCNPQHVRPVQPRENVLRGNSLAAAQASQTHCWRGHPFTIDNLRPAHLRLGLRCCRACHNIEQNTRRASKRRGLSGG